MEQRSPGETFADLAHQLHNQEGLEETLEALVNAAPALVGSDSAAVLLMRKGRLVEPGPGSDASAEKADRFQLEFEDGPAFRAVAELRTVHLGVIRTETSCRQWAEAVAPLGIGCALSVRLWTAEATLGALTFYAERPGWFDANALAVAEIVGRHASIALSSARHEDSLMQAVDGRKLVGQAQGILMERFDLDDRQAFEVLRRYSQANNTKLTEVARLLVDTRTLPDSVR